MEVGVGPQAQHPSRRHSVLRSVGLDYAALSTVRPNLAMISCSAVSHGRFTQLKATDKIVDESAEWALELLSRSSILAADSRPTIPESGRPAPEGKVSLCCLGLATGGRRVLLIDDPQVELVKKGDRDGCPAGGRFSR